MAASAEAEAAPGRRKRGNIVARDPKLFIEKNIRETVEAFQQRPEVTTVFG